MNDESEILYNCGKHGALTRDGVVKRGVRHQKQDYRCKACYKELKAIHYLKYKEKILAKHKARREANPELVREQKARSFQKHKEKYKEKRAKYKSKPKGITVNELFDQYAKDQLDKASEFHQQQTAEQLLQLKRIMQRMRSYSYRKRHENKLNKEKENGTK